MVPMVILACLLVAGCGQDSRAKAQMVCLETNQELRSLIPRVNQAEKAGLDQTVNLRAMSRITADGAARLERAGLTAQGERFAASTRKLSGLYARAASNPDRAGRLLLEARALQKSAAAQAKRAGLDGCGGAPPTHNHQEMGR